LIYKHEPSSALNKCDPLVDNVDDDIAGDDDDVPGVVDDAADDDAFDV
jgi:hypothetical protein